MITHCAAETRELGEQLAHYLHPGDVVVLNGNLGAGKSELTRGIAKGLKYPGVIPSPSFTILNVYEECTIPLYHFDWYRLSSSEELYEIGFDEYLQGDGIAVIEWAQNCPDAIPESYLEITIEIMNEQERMITFVFHGDFQHFSICDMEHIGLSEQMNESKHGGINEYSGD